MPAPTVHGKRMEHSESATEKMRVQFNKLADALGLTENGVLRSAPSLAIGTTSKKEVKHATFTTEIRGLTVSVTGAEVAFTATTHDIADPDADPREAYYTISVSSAGTVTITKGATAAADAAVKAAAPAGETVVGWVKIQHDGTAIFDATTNDLDAAHLTVTYEDAPVVSAISV